MQVMRVMRILKLITEGYMFLGLIGGELGDARSASIGGGI
jgi:hypothetical protein